MKRHWVLGLLLLFCLTIAASAMASPPAAKQHTGADVGIAPDPLLHVPDARDDSPVVTRTADPATKPDRFELEPVTNQEIGDGRCFEYIIFGFIHVWVGCETGGGGGGGW